MLLEYAQKAYKQGLIAGTSGNLSLRSDDGYIMITPSSMDYMEMTAGDLIVIDLDGRVIEGRHRPSSEWQLHTEIYKHMPEVMGVVHTHSPYATAFSVINEPIPLVLIEMVAYLKGDIPVAPVATQGTAEVGLGVLEALSQRTACLMQNHGAVSVGHSLPQAFVRAEYVEDAAKVCHLAKAIGTLTLIPDEMATEMLSR
jgi:L-ribulose-5-phosphate 4-epimerase